MVEERLVELAASVDEGLGALRQRHAATNTHSQTLRKIRFVDRRFGELTFNGDDEMKRDAAYEKFATFQTLSTVVGLLADFYVMMANGQEGPLAVTTVLDLPGFCDREVVRSLEKTQLKLIFVLNFLLKALRVGEDEAEKVNTMVKAWRDRQVMLTEGTCNDFDGTDEGTSVAKLIVAC